MPFTALQGLAAGTAGNGNPNFEKIYSFNGEFVYVWAHQGGYNFFFVSKILKLISKKIFNIYMVYSI